MDVPCPPMYLVADNTDISAPCSIGFKSPTVAVLSTMSGILASCAMSANFSKSGTSNFGFPRDYTYTTFVFSSIAASNSSGFSESTNLTVLPSRGSV